MTFIERCLAGEAQAGDIDDHVDRWHNDEGALGVSLAEFLGFTDEEYRMWAEHPHLLPEILEARRGASDVA